MKARHLKLKAIQTGNLVEIYAEKKRKDGSTFTSAWLGTVDLPEFVEFVTYHFEDLRLRGYLPGIPAATLCEQFAFAASLKK
jgi:hypothetical protein